MRKKIKFKTGMMLIHTAKAFGATCAAVASGCVLEDCLKKKNKLGVLFSGIGVLTSLYAVYEDSYWATFYHENEYWDELEINPDDLVDPISEA